MRLTSVVLAGLLFVGCHSSTAPVDPNNPVVFSGSDEQVWTLSKDSYGYCSYFPVGLSNPQGDWCEWTSKGSFDLSGFRSVTLTCHVLQSRDCLVGAYLCQDSTCHPAKLFFQTRYGHPADSTVSVELTDLGAYTRAHLLFQTASDQLPGLHVYDIVLHGHR